MSSPRAVHNHEERVADRPTRPRIPIRAPRRPTRTCITALACLLVPWMAAAQGLIGTLICTVTDAQGGVLQGAVVRISSAALIGRSETRTTNETGQLRFAVLPPGTYLLEIQFEGFAAYHESDIPIGAGATIARTVVLNLAGRAESVVVEGAGSRIEARDAGFGTRFGLEDLRAIPVRRASMFDLIRLAPGISPTSAASGTVTTISAFGSGTNENQFLFDGTNFTCPCNGVARAEPGLDFIQEVHVQSVGASAEYGSVQGAVINVITRQGGDRFQYDASYYAVRAPHEPARAARAPHACDRAERVRARPVWRRHDEPRRTRDSRSALVLRGLPVSPRQRQSAGDGPGVSENLRAGQDLRQTHVETRLRITPAAEL